MAIHRGHGFGIELDSAFPQGVVLIGEVAPDPAGRYARSSTR
jgi:hypothetical protein